MTSRDTLIRHLRTEVSGVDLFYREAGDPVRGTIVLAPGHPSGAHAYDGPTARLAANRLVIAPDYPGYGFGAAPMDAPWTFDSGWWEDRAKGQADVDGFPTIAGTRLQWEAGARDVSTIDPAMWTLEQALLDQPGHKEAAEALPWDDQTNPGVQSYLREHQPPLTAVWGESDPFLIPPGAEADKRDVPDAEVVLLDTGHFGLVEETAAIPEHADALLRRAYA